MPNPVEFNNLGFASQQSQNINDSYSDGGWFFDTILGQWLFPGVQQNQEVAQQFEMQQYQNEWNSETARMERMKAAGINPNTAAAGIAGAGASPSVPSPNTASSPDPASIPNSISEAAGVIGQNVLAGSQANEINTLLGVNKEKIHSETVANLEKAGLDHWSAMSVATLLPTLAPNAMADIYMKLAQIDNVRAHYDNIVAEHDEILSNIRRNDAQASLMEQQQLTEAENTRFTKATTDFFIEHGYRDDAAGDVALRNAIVTGKGDPNEIGNAIYNASHSYARGRYDAETETAYNRMLAEARAKAETDVDFAQYYNDLRNYSELVKALIQLEYTTGSGMMEILDRVASMINRNVDDGRVRGVPAPPRKPSSQGDPNN